MRFIMRNVSVVEAVKSQDLQLASLETQEC